MDFVKELKGLSVRLYNTYGIHCDSARLALLAAKELERLAEDLRRLHAEVEALRKDAERYRWLRHGDNDEEVLRFHDWATEVCVDPPPMYLPRLDRLDRLIDEAKKEANHG